MAVLLEALEDRRTFLFHDGVTRTFANEYARFMSMVELDEESAADAQRFFDKHTRRASTTQRERKPATKAKKTKPKTKTKAKAKAVEGE